jgi:acyl carrier protein
MTIRSEIITQLVQVAKEQNKRQWPLADDVPLLDSGLDSLCFAILVARLEDVLGVDPFTEAAAQDLPFPKTLGEFIRFYEVSCAA